MTEDVVGAVVAAKAELSLMLKVEKAVQVKGGGHDGGRRAAEELGEGDGGGGRRGGGRVRRKKCSGGFQWGRGHFGGGGVPVHMTSLMAKNDEAGSTVMRWVWRCLSSIFATPTLSANEGSESFLINFDSGDVLY